MRASEFLNSVVTNDLLLEILVRLPDARTAIQASAVCQRWRSLVGHPSFVEFFAKHRSGQSKKAVALFSYSSYGERPFHQLSLSRRHEEEGCEDSESPTPQCDLNFKPAQRPPLSLCQQKPRLFTYSYLRRLETKASELVIRACCDDLVLLSSSDDEYYVCNWLTKEVVPLPSLPCTENAPQENAGYWSDAHALVRSGCDYRVLIFKRLKFDRDGYVLKARIFNTKTRSWSNYSYVTPATMELHYVFSFVFDPEVAVTADRVAFWLYGHYHLKGLVAFDAFASSVRLVPLPFEVSFGEICCLSFRHRVRVGTVLGRLWVSEMTEFRLRIWELDGRCTTWQLVHDVSFSKKETEHEFLCVLAFDPNDDNAIFLMRDQEIVRYEFDRSAAARVCNIPCYSSENVPEIENRVASHLKVLTLVHPRGPSSISQFREY